MTKRHYREAANHALAGFQMLEAGLKLYLRIYYDAVRALLDGRLAFDFQHHEIDNAALGRLVSLFAKATFNTKLVSDIRSLISHRDELAHQALAHSYGDELPDASLRSRADSYVDIATKVNELMRAVHVEQEHLVRVLEEHGRRA